MAARGLARQWSQGRLESAWDRAVGPGTAVASRTRVAGLRRGVLHVTVAHSSLLEELAAFRHHELLQSLGESLPDLAIRRLKFRVGPVTDEDATPADT